MDDGVGGEFGHDQGGVVGEIRRGPAPQRADREMAGGRGRVPGKGEGARRPGGARIREVAGELPVQAAHLGERVRPAALGERPGRIAAEQRERVRAAQLIPPRLELNRRVDQPGVPEHGHHLGVGPDRAAARARGLDQGTDLAAEAGFVEVVAGHELADQFRRVQDQVGIAVGGRVQVDSGPPQPGLEFAPVRRGGDDDGRAAPGERAQQVAGHPLG